MPLRLQVVTAERMVYEDDVDMVIAPAWDGLIGILPHHVALLTVLQVGELVVKKGGSEQSLVIDGGFLEVSADRVTVLADAAEHAEEIDIQHAEEARRRAQQLLAAGTGGEPDAAAQMAMRRAVVRLRVAQGRRLRHSPPETEA
ncbi:MAG: F0F1 ATP synthase subunit epsilon [Chloroflexia bacterium]